jgi:sucrose-6-phosphate hydrolase SacC (GH32 family)
MVVTRFQMPNRSSWINDPNGPIHYCGTYHLYHQYLPTKKQWDFGVHWGHATSRDLKEWKHHGSVLEPSCHFDKDGCFSGNTIIHDGILYAFYTGVSLDDGFPSGFREVQAAAQSSDGFEFVKSAKPILEVPCTDIANQLSGWRDPFVFLYQGTYYMLLGSGIRDKMGTVLLYRGGKHPVEDPYYLVNVLMTWPKGNFMLECPFLIPIGNERWMLGASPDGEMPQYWLGRFNGLVFVVDKGPESIAPEDPDFYAATVTAKQNSGPLQQDILWGWQKKDRSILGTTFDDAFVL